MEKQVIIDYTQNYLTVKEILKKYKIGQDKFYSILKDNGVERIDKQEAIYMRSARKHGYSGTMSQLEQEVIDIYNDGNGQAKTGREFGISADGVKFILKKHNIHIRNQQEATALSNENRRFYSVNDDYFLTQSHNMAWLLGFIASDGNVSKDNNRIKISLSSVDKEILEKIKEELEIEANIKDYVTNNGFYVSELCWPSRKHKQTLANYSIIPNKTFLLKPPYGLEEEYHIDYVRGCFDGDGSISLIKNSNGRGQGNIRFQIASATEEILEWILDVFERYGITRPKIQVQIKPSGTPLYYFQYSSVMSRKIYHILYTPNSLRLERKYQHYTEVVKLFE